jgi:hypothetical protein
MLTTSPELVFHSAGVKKLIGRRTSLSSGNVFILVGGIRARPRLPRRFRRYKAFV